jgi:hypothetical protein
MPALTSTEMRGEARVLVGLSLEPPRQARWTILLRLVLAFPLLVVAFFVSIAGLVAVIVSWFAALLIGRVPDGL